MLLLAMTVTTGARASAPVAVGLFVGSNRPGDGQTALRYAGQDVERMRAVLTEIGGLDPTASKTLIDPSADELLLALDAARERLDARARAGGRTVFVFYYSGHAHADALTLGPTELGLDALRAELETMPSTVTVAFLDACQSGAISGIKGITPAESFSWNSAEVLSSEGLAVMASSTGTELSQESAEIGGSFFTYNLVSGLRGAADRNTDGVVSLDEAYGYAYDRTLAATAVTRTGGQHVTLETELRGQGDMVLTRPAAADAGLSIDGPWTGRIVVVASDNQAVVAEVVRQGASPYSLALPAGRYEALIHGRGEALRCPIRLESGTVTTLSSAPCARVRAAETSPKGMNLRERTKAFQVEKVGVEWSWGDIRKAPSSPFYQTLEAFGFVHAQVALPYMLTRYKQITVPVAIRPHIALAFTGGTLGELSFGSDPGYVLDSWRAGVYPRFVTPLGAPALVGYAQAGPGLSHVRETIYQASRPSFDEEHWAAHLAAGVGLQVMVRTRWVAFGGFLQTEAIWAPSFRNEFDQVADVGGLAVSVGLRVSP